MVTIFDILMDIILVLQAQLPLQNSKANPLSVAFFNTRGWRNLANTLIYL